MEQFELKDTRSGFGQGLLELGHENPNVIGLCADLTGSLKMDAFEKKFPKFRMLDVVDTLGIMIVDK